MTTKEAICGCLMELIEQYPKACKSRDHLQNLASTAKAAMTEQEKECDAIFRTMLCLNELLPDDLKQKIVEIKDPNEIPY